MTEDYTITMKDRSGRTAVLYINGTAIDEQIATGLEDWEARESVESNAFGNAIERGEIGEDAWSV